MKIWLLTEPRGNGIMVVTSAHRTLKGAEKKKRSLLDFPSARISEYNVAD